MYRHAIITRPTAKASTRRTRERRSVPPSRRRKTRTPTAARQNALMVRSDTRSVSSAASSLAEISRRLCGPKEPNAMRLSCSTTAAMYAAVTRARSKRARRRPEGAERHAAQLQHHGGDVRGRHQGALEAVAEVSRRERHEHVHEEDRRK